MVLNPEKLHKIQVTRRWRSTSIVRCRRLTSLLILFTRCLLPFSTFAAVGGLSQRECPSVHRALFYLVGAGDCPPSCWHTATSDKEVADHMGLMVIAQQSGLLQVCLTWSWSMLCLELTSHPTCKFCPLRKRKLISSDRL